MILSERREEWERGLEEVGVFPSTTGGTSVILKKTVAPSKGAVNGNGSNHKVYFLHRYFAVGDQWQCSIDVNGGTLEQCVKVLSEQMTGKE